MTEKLMKTAKVKCPSCGHFDRLNIPRKGCLEFYECSSCHEIIASKQNECCVICSYSNII